MLIDGSWEHSATTETGTTISRGHKMACREKYGAGDQPAVAGSAFDGKIPAVEASLAESRNPYSAHPESTGLVSASLEGNADLGAVRQPDNVPQRANACRRTAAASRSLNIRVSPVENERAVASMSISSTKPGLEVFRE